MRQSTFSSIPHASSRAGKNAITKQISEVGSLEPKMSFKLKNVGSKVSLRLKRYLFYKKPSIFSPFLTFKSFTDSKIVEKKKTKSQVGKKLVTGKLVIVEK